MSERPIIKLTRQHLVVPAVRGCGSNTTLRSQCDIPVPVQTTPIDFTSPTSGSRRTSIMAANGTGRGDKPETSDGTSLDVFTTSCSMGDPKKRTLVEDGDGKRANQFNTVFAKTLCGQGDCGPAWNPLSTHCSFGWSAACNAKIQDQGNCEKLAYDPPSGYVPGSTITQECKLNEISNYTNKEENVPSTWLDRDLKACSYNYRKDWDRAVWHMPSKIYDQSYYGSIFDRSLFNSNNIPKNRMKCCLGEPLDGETSFYPNKCPIDTSKFKWESQGTTPEHGNDPPTPASDSDIRAYVPDSVMCNGGRVPYLNDEELIKTPQYWCGGYLENSAGRQEILGELDRSNFEKIYNLLDDVSCNNWTDKDTGGLNSECEMDCTRNIALANTLSPIYGNISYFLASDQTLNPFKTGYSGEADTRIDLLPGDNTYNKTEKNPDFLGNNFKFPIPLDQKDDMSKSVQYLRLLNILSHPRTEKFLRYVEPTGDSGSNYTAFNNNMEIFCNRSDIFNFKNYGLSSFDDIPDNRDLAEKYKHLCACYWSAGEFGAPFNPAKSQSSIAERFNNIFPPDSDRTKYSHDLLSDINNLVEGDIPNECWENKCISLYNDSESKNNYSNLKTPYRRQASPGGCPSICTSVCVAKASVEYEENPLNTGNTEVNIYNTAQNKCSQSCNENSQTTLPDNTQHEVNQDICESHQGITQNSGSPGSVISSPVPSCDQSDDDTDAFPIPSPGSEGDEFNNLPMGAVPNEINPENNSKNKKKNDRENIKKNNIQDDNELYIIQFIIFIITNIFYYIYKDGEMYFIDIGIIIVSNVIIQIIAYVIISIYMTDS